MSILLNNAPYDNAPWVHYLNQYLPDIPVWVYPDIPDPTDVKYAAIWDHPHYDLERYSNLRAILNLGAGMDLIDQQPSLPDVPLVRLVDPEVGTDMAQFALYWVLHFQRRFEEYRRLAKDKNWQRLDYINSSRHRVLVLGMGLIGQQVAEYLARNQFDVAAWNRSEKSVPNVKSFCGDDEILEALGNADVVINCLPLNKGTKHLLNEHALSRLPKGASLINISRGGVIDHMALVSLLESGHIAAAALDVFDEEPLPSSSELWQMDNVFVTPHMSGATYASSAARVLADNIERMEQGVAPFPIYKP